MQHRRCSTYSRAGSHTPVNKAENTDCTQKGCLYKRNTSLFPRTAQLPVCSQPRPRLSQAGPRALPPQQRLPLPEPCAAACQPGPPSPERPRHLPFRSLQGRCSQEVRPKGPQAARRPQPPGHTDRRTAPSPRRSPAAPRSAPCRAMAAKRKGQGFSAVLTAVRPR